MEDKIKELEDQGYLLRWVPVASELNLRMMFSSEWLDTGIYKGTRPNEVALYKRRKDTDQEENMMVRILEEAKKLSLEYNNNNQ